LQPLIITVAAVGAELTLEQQPNLPITPEQLAADAAACAEAGASIYHLHVRDADGRPTMDVETFERAQRAIADASELIVQFTTGGAVTDGPEARLAPLDLKPEMATLTTGTVNFGDEIFSNPLPLVAQIYRKERELGVLPEFEIFDAGMIATADRLYQELGSDHHRHYDFVLGVPGGMPAWDDSVGWLASKLPADASWTATGIGRHHDPVATEAARLGGHIRTGFEDVRYLEPGRLAASNRELVERAVAIAKGHGREVATPEQSRNLLGL
jgi:3-keto-5-aminohexanoate cleavage enzyme